MPYIPLHFPVRAFSNSYAHSVPSMPASFGHTNQRFRGGLRFRLRFAWLTQAPIVRGHLPRSFIVSLVVLLVSNLLPDIG